mmetsp:Transcript_29955/g.40634  ORF Transcript_29955/g.40634 Transcript_29955/m.40634 type:complete len:261 (+) Transcript_29955:130-912(+)
MALISPASAALVCRRKGQVTLVGLSLCFVSLWHMRVRAPPPALSLRTRSEALAASTTSGLRKGPYPRKRTRASRSGSPTWYRKPARSSTWALMATQYVIARSTSSSGRPGISARAYSNDLSLTVLVPDGSRTRWERGLPHRQTRRLATADNGWVTNWATTENLKSGLPHRTSPSRLVKGMRSRSPGWRSDQAWGQETAPSLPMYSCLTSRPHLTRSSASSPCEPDRPHPVTSHGDRCSRSPDRCSPPSKRIFSLSPEPSS